MLRTQGHPSPSVLSSGSGHRTHIFPPEHRYHEHVTEAAEEIEQLDDIPIPLYSAETQPEHYNAGSTGHLAISGRNKGPGATAPPPVFDPPRAHPREIPRPHRERPFQRQRPPAAGVHIVRRPDVPEAEPDDDDEVVAGESNYALPVALGVGAAILGVFLVRSIL